MSMNLFGGGGASAAPRNLTEIKAGCYTQKDEQDGKIRLKPLATKGKLRVLVIEDLLHFQWVNRTNGEVGHDLVLFPGDATFKKVKQAPSGRVYQLHFASSDRRIFFWMQAADDKDDEKVAEAINKAITTGVPPTESGGGGDSGAANMQMQMLQQIANLPQAEQMQLLQALSAESGMNAEQLQAIMGSLGGGGGGGGGGGSSTSAAAAAASSSAAAAPAATPAASNNSSGSSSAAPTVTPAPAPMDTDPPGAPARAAAPSSSSSAAARALQPSDLAGALQSAVAGNMQPVGPDLRNVLAPESVLPIIRSDNVREALSEALPFLPAECQDVEQILRNPSFQQALGAFTAALEGDELNSLLAQLGLRGGMTPGMSGVEVFLHALQQRANEQQPKPEGEGGDGK